MCTVCGSQIRMMAFTNMGVCCETCRKVRDGDAHFNPEMAEYVRPK